MWIASKGQSRKVWCGSCYPESVLRRAQQGLASEVSVPYARLQRKREAVASLERHRQVPGSLASAPWFRKSARVRGQTRPFCLGLRARSWSRKVS